MSKQPPPSDLGAALQQATQRALQRTLKTVFRHKTWPGVFVLMGEVETRWEGRGRDSPYWSHLRVLKGRAERLAENPAVPQGDRDRARRVCALVDDFIRLAGPPEGLCNLSIWGFKKARDHLEKLDKAGCELREAAETLGLADQEKPIYVPSTYVFGKHAQKVQRATDREHARCRRQWQSRAAEAAAKHGQCPPLTPDAAAAHASGVAPASKWQDIQRKLLNLAKRGEPYTADRELGRRVGCSPGTVNKAVKRSPELRAWKAQKTKGRPKAQSLTASIAGSIASGAADSANTLLDDEVDKTMKILIAQAKPAERAKLAKLDKDARRRLVKAASEQAEDLFNEYHAPKGNRTLDREP